jgi:RNA polymerase sigma-70 factor (ECF subfamily)
VTEEADELDSLARAAAGGDRSALDALLRQVEGRVRARCLRILPNPSDAEEAAQETLLAVSQRIGRFEGRCRFTTWMYQVATNVALDTYRKLKRQAPAGGDDVPALVANERTSVLAGGRVDLLDALERVERAFVEPVVLRDLGQLSYEEIANLLDIPLGTVKSRVHEGRRRLERLLAERS